MNPPLLILTLVLTLGAVCLLYGFFLEPCWIRARKFRIAGKTGQEAAGKTFLFFSDLHTGARTSRRKLDRQMRAIMNMKPDAIFFGGDLVEERTPLYQPDFRAMVVDALSSLEAPLGKWAIYGNHDVEAPRFRQWVTDVLEESGFTLLENQGVELEGLPVWGFANTHHGSPVFEADQDGRFTLFLVHESDWFPEALPQKSQGLVLTGHSHYGQVTFFGLPLIRPAGAKKYWRGHYPLGENLSMIVSAGLGTVHIHARFFARPDLLFLRFGEK
ncbi:MAG: hypothetical protein GX809_05555 [Clostridiaceae bacterium]|jgi:predicted MPP superfamily phosphohydrolase|nr:hypothetical protein [Clostridiaceae bacterium]